jgi:hypothetical protein
MRRISSNARMRILANANNPLATVTGAESAAMSTDSMRRVASSSSLSSLCKSNFDGRQSVVDVIGEISVNNFLSGLVLSIIYCFCLSFNAA